MVDRSRLTRGDGAALAAWFAAGLGGLLVFVALYGKAFPEASVEITVGREAALAASRSYLESLGYDLGSYRSAIAFRADRQAKTYLEKELGLAAADRLMREAVSVWYWRCRWFKAEEEEEFFVELGPGGRLRGFTHRIPEQEAGERLSAEEARGQAEAFLRGLPHVDFARYRLIESREKDQPNRRDHTFLWEREGFRAGEATYRIRVGFQGRSIGSYSEFLKVPEEWRLNESRKNAHRGLLYTIANTGYSGFMLACYVVFVFWLKKRRLRFRFAVVLGGTLAFLSVVEWLNSLSIMWMGYRTTESIGAFFGYQCVGVGLGAIQALFGILIVGSAGDALSREVFPDRIPISQMATRTFWTTKEVFIAGFVGCCLAFVHAAYVALFYVAGDAVGVWSPLQSPATDLLGTPFPWLYPLTIGLFASLNEELLFRLFAISLLVYLFKRRWIAVLLPAVVWGFLHSTYPQEPAFTRGIELSLVGILFGVVFIRYGFLASIISHYTYNALLSSMVLLQSGDGYLQASGAVVVGLMVLPVAPGIGLLLLRRPFSVPLRETGLPLSPPPKSMDARLREPPGRTPYHPVPRLRYAFLLAIGVGGWIVSQNLSFEGFGDYVEMRVQRSEAEAIAIEHLEKRGVETGDYSKVTYFSNELSGSQIDFLYQQLGAEGLNDFCETHLGDAVSWATRFFKPLDPAEYVVWVLPSGDVNGYRHVVTEEAPGAKMSLEAAREAAENFVARQQVADLNEFRLVDAASEELTNRTDHSFVWERIEPVLEEGTVRLYAPVQGDEVTFATSFVDIPDEWYRSRRERNFGDVLMLAGGIALAAGVTMALGALFMVFFVRDLLRWSVGIAAASLVAVLELVDAFNESVTFWQRYPTESEPAVYLGERFIEGATGLAVEWIAVCVLATYADVLFRRAFPTLHSIGEWFGRSEGGKGSAAASAGVSLPIRRGWGEGIVLGFAVGWALLFLSLFTIFDGPWLQPDAGEMSVNATAPSPRFDQAFEGRFPAISILVNAGRLSIFACIVLAGGISLYKLYLRRYARSLFVAGIVLSLASVLGAPTLDTAVKGLAALWLGAGLFLALTYGLVRWGAKANLAAYPLLFFFSEVLSDGYEMTSAPNSFVLQQGWILLGTCGAIAVLGLWLAAGSRDRGPGEYAAPGG